MAGDKPEDEEDDDSEEEEDDDEEALGGADMDDWCGWDYENEFAEEEMHAELRAVVLLADTLTDFGFAEATLSMEAAWVAATLTTVWWWMVACACAA